MFDGPAPAPSGRAIGASHAVQLYLPNLIYGANDGIVTALFVTVAGRALFSDRRWFAARLDMLVLGAIASAVAYGVGAGGAALLG
jgi:hypothetical protein